MLRDGGTFAFLPVERQEPPPHHPPTPLSLSDKDRAEMLYHDHPVLIKPYQICVSEHKSQEVGSCKCMFDCQHVFISMMDSFEGFSF